MHDYKRKVVREINLHTLARLCIPIDKYEFHEAVELFSDTWFAHLKEAVPSKFTNDILPWIFVSYVLKKPTHFTQATRVALRESSRDLDAKELPVPGPVISKRTLHLLG